MNEEKNISVNWDVVLGETDILAGRFQREILSLIKPFYDAAIKAQQDLEIVKGTAKKSSWACPEDELAK